MTDTVSKKKRSEIMRAVKSKETKIEIAFRKILWGKGFRYSKNSSKYFGKPDIVLKKYKAVIFIDSCFWHGCRYHCRLPSSNVAYWQNKIRKNKLRDALVIRHYKQIDWKHFRIWEHQIQKDLVRTIAKITNSISN